MDRLLKLLPCLLIGAAVALAPVEAQDYSDGWNLDPAEDPLLEDDDDDDGGGETPTLYYRDVNTHDVEIYKGRDDSVSGITESKVVRPEPVEAKVEEVDENDDWGKTHGKHQRTHSPRPASGSGEAEKPKTGSGGVGAGTASDDDEEEG